LATPAPKPTPRSPAVDAHSRSDAHRKHHLMLAERAGDAELRRGFRHDSSKDGDGASAVSPEQDLSGVSGTLCAGGSAQLIGTRPP
jgi:hypothetical protein